MMPDSSDRQPRLEREAAPRDQQRRQARQHVAEVLHLIDETHPTRRAGRGPTAPPSAARRGTRTSAGCRNPMAYAKLNMPSRKHTGTSRATVLRVHRPRRRSRRATSAAATACRPRRSTSPPPTRRCDERVADRPVRRVAQDRRRPGSDRAAARTRSRTPRGSRRSAATGRSANGARRRHEQDAGGQDRGRDGQRASAGVGSAGNTASAISRPTDVAAKPMTGFGLAARMVSDMLRRSAAAASARTRAPTTCDTRCPSWRSRRRDRARRRLPAQSCSSQCSHRKHEPALRPAGDPLRNFRHGLHASSALPGCSRWHAGMRDSVSNSIESRNGTRSSTPRGHAHHVAVAQQLVAHVARQLEPADRVLGGRRIDRAVGRIDVDRPRRCSADIVRGQRARLVAGVDAAEHLRRRSRGPASGVIRSLSRRSRTPPTSPASRTAAALADRPSRAASWPHPSPAAAPRETTGSRRTARRRQDPTAPPSCRAAARGGRP